MVEEERKKDNRNEKTTMIIIDSKSIQNADTAKEKGYDAWKKSGIKLHIGVDILGLPHALHITTANVGDREGAIGMIDFYCNRSNYFSMLKKVLADGGYTGEAFAHKIVSLCGAEVEIVKRNEISNFVVLPKRWFIECSFGWLDKYRRLWKNCEGKLQNSLHMVTLAFVRLLLPRC